MSSHKLNIETGSSVFTEEPPGDTPKMHNKIIKYPFRDIICTEESVGKLLSDLDGSKSQGPDQMHPKVMKELKSIINKPLSIIFNKSLEDSQVPSAWKEANITAIFKKGSKSDPGNYRPVSLTSIVGKTMEKIVRNSIVNHMENNDLFSNKQFGFIAKRSTVLQLLMVLEDWTDILDHGGEIDVIYMDFMKAFDKVPDYTSSNTYLFADDTKIYREIKSDEDRKAMQQDLDKLQEWSNKWLLKFHPLKCKVLTIKQKRKETWTYHMAGAEDNVALENITSEKDIGVTVDKDLNFSMHMQQAVNKANSIVGFIRRSFVYLDEVFFTQLFKALVRPHLEYAASVWNPYKIKDIESTILQRPSQESRTPDIGIP
ncbi:uncharacterized protein LOC132546435 [Ylistrum balloti]|uniref:uncharacterized protein LOC132546435 n=1 Tax=Ylistrum balloti TaxID=509963 RepID=UPI002905E031|nr:uncharacterized protein LOC132546435 [Ylistrum balloti]